MNYNTVSISYMCSQCSEYSIFDINLFAFSGKKKLEIYCKCHESNIKISKALKNFKIDVYCPICDEIHSYTVPVKQFWSGDVYSYSCPYYEAYILFIGESSLIEDAIREYIGDEFIDDSKSSLSIESSNIELITTVSKFISNYSLKLNFCNCCDNHYKLAYNDKEIFIICNSCHHSLPIKYEDVDLFLTSPEKFKNIK